MTDNKKIFELYNLMEERLQELEISFDEFTVLYEAFRNPVEKKEKKLEATPPKPFPFIKYAGEGWTTK